MLLCRNSAADMDCREYWEVVAATAESMQALPGSSQQGAELAKVCNTLHELLQHDDNDGFHHLAVKTGATP